VRWLDRLLVSIAAAVAVLGLLPIAARLWWILDLTTHFRLQYLGVAAAVLLLLALRRQWRAAALLLVIAALNAWPVLPYVSWPSPASASTAPGEPLKVMTVNVSYRPFSARRFHEIVAEAAPDVLLVVEFTPHAAEVLADLDNVFAYELKAPAEGPYGIALWSRFPLAAAATFPLGSVPALEARVQTPGREFTLLGVHLSAPRLPRRAQQRNEELALLAARRAAIAGPLIVAGDFNVTPYSPYFTDWLAVTGLTDTRRGRTLAPSWPATLPILGIPIDHVAVTSDFAIRGHRRLPAFGSDHWAVLAELTLHFVNESP
jgi:endonuclease/exonuclease/phosphatase (EEP) superfamily protein YafD